MENIYKIVVSKEISQEWSDHFYIRSSRPLVEVDGMIQDMEEVDLEKYLVQINSPDNSASLVTGSVEIFRGEINRGEKVVDWEIDSNEVVDWEIDSNEIDQDSIQRKIEGS